jgi:Uma2 family endonuclease
MGEAGIFGEDDRVELVEGEIVEMTPIGWRHAQAVTTLTTILAQQVAASYDISVQDPLTLHSHTQHQPDLALLSKDRPLDRIPEAKEAPLVVEVADTSLGYDREVKLPLYARAGIPEAWLVDLNGGAIEVHTEPSSEGYKSRRIARRGETVVSGAVEEVFVGVHEVLGSEDPDG